MSINLKVKVTKSILEHTKMCGKYNNDILEKGVLTNCAVALAVRDIFPFATVNYQTICIYKSPKYVNFFGIITLPNEVSKYIQAFDKLRPEDRTKMPELEFEIEIPEEIINEINIEEIKTLLINHPTLELV